MNQLAVHHHFKISDKNIGNCKHVRFQHIPCFKLYHTDSLSVIRRFMENRLEPMPHKYQNVLQSHTPHVEAKDHYRSEHFPTQFLSSGRRRFFGRIYQLKQNDHVKVEVTFDSRLLSDRKTYTLESAVNTANRFFNQLEGHTYAQPLDLKKHAPDYYHPQEVETLIGTLQDQINSSKDKASSPLSSLSKREDIKSQIKNLNLNRREIAQAIRQSDVPSPQNVPP